MNNLFVVLLGIGTVFIGLICIILLCKVISLLCQFGNKDEKTNTSDIPAAPTTAPVSNRSAKAVIPNRRETVAAIAAAIAEDLGTDVSAIRILSIEQL